MKRIQMNPQQGSDIIKVKMKLKSAIKVVTSRRHVKLVMNYL